MSGRTLSLILGVALVLGHVPGSGVLAADKGGNCSYRKCIERCWASGEQTVVVARKGGSSCPVLCKHKGCAEYDDPQR